MSEQQIKSKQRVADHGEVFTSEREVNAMLDLVKQETERIDSCFLEPACGDGNFLAEILRRKLKVVTDRYKGSQIEWERYAILAVSSIYGVDILQDNVDECRERLYLIFTDTYDKVFRQHCTDDCKASARFILKKNVLFGDALTMRIPGTAKDKFSKDDPIIFAEWSAVNGSLMKRRDFTLASLLEHAPIEEKDQQVSLFSDQNEEVFLPTPVKEYPLVHFLKVSEYE